MTKGQDFLARAHFVEDIVGTFLKQKPDFHYIKFAKSHVTDCEYVRIADRQGRAITMDVTARSLEAIAEDIARILLIEKEKVSPPDNIVTEPHQLREVSHLF